MFQLAEALKRAITGGNPCQAFFATLIWDIPKNFNLYCFIKDNVQNVPALVNLFSSVRAAAIRRASGWGAARSAAPGAPWPRKWWPRCAPGVGAVAAPAEPAPTPAAPEGPPGGPPGLRHRRVRPHPRRAPWSRAPWSWWAAIRASANPPWSSRCWTASAGQGCRGLYISGEESEVQLKLRADRLGVSSPPNCWWPPRPAWKTSSRSWKRCQPGLPGPGFHPDHVHRHHPPRPPVP